MRQVARVVAASAALGVATAFAADACFLGTPSARSSWDLSLNAYPTLIRGGADYTSLIAAADHGQLHLEARYGYESVGARSAFVGWTFTGGDAVTWELTPLLGGAWGTTHAFVPGVEASLGWGRGDFYVEAEFVRDNTERAGSYVYAWSELAYRPVEWLRVGVAGQRSRAYGGDRDLQRGPFVQLTKGPMTLGGYWFNPGSNDQVFVGSIGVTF